MVAPIIGARDTGQLLVSPISEELTLPDAIPAALDDVSDVELRRLG